MQLFHNIIQMSSDENAIFTAKILLLGESAVGKSSLMLQFTDNKFKDYIMQTIGVDFKTKIIEVDNTSIKLQIFDTAGQEKFRTITRTYYQGAKGILVVFDISRPETFRLTKYWIDSIKEQITGDVDIALVGNKCDLVRAVDKEEAAQFAKENNIPYFETSAKNNTNVDEIFTYLGKSAYERTLKGDPEPVKPQKVIITENNSKEEQKKSGCDC